jgi:hypothetical protein
LSTSASSIGLEGIEPNAQAPMSDDGTPMALRRPKIPHNPEIPWLTVQKNSTVKMEEIRNAAR